MSKLSVRPLDISVVGGTYVDYEVMVQGVIRGDVSLEVSSRSVALGGPGYCYALELARLGVSVRLETVLGSCQWSQQARATLRSAGADVAAPEREGSLDNATVLIDAEGTKLVFNDYRQSASVECTADTFSRGLPVLIASPTSVGSVITAIAWAERKGPIPPLLFAPHSRQVRQIGRLTDPEWEVLRRALHVLCVNESDLAPGLESRLSPHTLLLVTRGARGCSVRREGHWSHYPAKPLAVDVDNSNGAGEAFFAGFVSASLSGASIDCAVEQGSLNAVRYLQERHLAASAATAECA